MPQEDREDVAQEIESESWIDMVDGNLYVEHDLVVPGLSDVAERLHRWGWSDSNIVDALSRGVPTTIHPTQDEVKSIVEELLRSPFSPPPAA